MKKILALLLALTLTMLCGCGGQKADNADSADSTIVDTVDSSSTDVVDSSSQETSSVDESSSQTTTSSKPSSEATKDKTNHDDFIAYWKYKFAISNSTNQVVTPTSIYPTSLIVLDDGTAALTTKPLDINNMTVKWEYYASANGSDVYNIILNDGSSMGAILLNVAEYGTVLVFQFPEYTIYMEKAAVPN